jgi:hypothetical protein
MNKQIICILLLFHFSITSHIYAQGSNGSDSTKKITKLFRNQKLLPIKLSYSNKKVNKNTNDSTYLKSTLKYKKENGEWNTIDVELRARGNFRRKNCYFPPIKIKIKSEVSKGTLFKGNKKLKLVLPCLLQKDKNDNVIKEYIAYKLYELISPYHFKTRLADITLNEPKGKKIKTHYIKGFLIEDDKKIAKRHNGKMFERSIDSRGQHDLTSVQNAFFQFMIGNVDFSATKQHNAKLLYIDKKIYPIPYDFDMCGLVNASYASVSQTQNNAIKITSVTQRQYRGFKRDFKIIEQVRQEFLSKKNKMLEIVDSYESSFENQSEFDNCKLFILDFFRIMKNDKRFNDEILNALRG